MSRKAIEFHLVPIDAIDDSIDFPETDEGLETLREQALAAASSAPVARVAETTRVVRDRILAVKRYVLARAVGRCESCGGEAPFTRPNGHPYLEPHHTTRMADGGLDDTRFVGAICPNCHCEIHYGAEGEQKNKRLMEQIAETEYRQSNRGG